MKVMSMDDMVIKCQSSISNIKNVKNFENVQIG